MGLGRADDRRRDQRVAQDPRQGDLGHADAACLGELLHGVDDGFVVRGVERLDDLVGAGAVALLTGRAGEAALAVRGVRHETHAHVAAHRHQLSFVVPAQQVVLILHRHEPGPAAEVGGVLELRELPRVHRGGADVARLARLDDVVQRLHRLLDRRVRVEAVDLVQVDVVRAEPRQRRVDLFEDRLARQALSAGAVVHLPPHLRREHDVLTAGVAGDRAADDLFGRAELIDVRGVPERHAELDGLLEERLCLVFGERPRVGVRGGRVAVAHAAEREPAHLQSGVPQAGVLHRHVHAGFGADQCREILCSNARASTPSSAHPQRRRLRTGDLAPAASRVPGYRAGSIVVRITVWSWPLART